MIPKGSEKTDWEVELAVVIGTRASYVSERDALAHVAGYCVCNDVSERAYQLERGGGQWTKGKGCPTFGPLGPWLVTADEIADPQKLSMWLDVNGERMQNGSTATMIFGVRTLVSYISHFMILEPGDVITTGTPPGVGIGQEAAAFSQGRRHDLARHRRLGTAGAARGRLVQGGLSDRPGRPRDEDGSAADEGDEIGDRRAVRGALCAGLRRGLCRLSRQGRAMARGRAAGRSSPCPSRWRCAGSPAARSISPATRRRG